MPTELIAEILSFVPDHRSVLLTCTKLNEISQNTKFYKLHLVIKYRDKRKILEDDSVFESIMGSNRRINALTIEYKATEETFLEVSSFARLKLVIERFGKDIKKLKSILILCPPNIIELLNLMPNLEEIDIRSFWSMSANFNDGKLELHNLKTVKVWGWQPKALKLFDSLPPGVLREICYESTFFGQLEKDEKLFPNQNNIKKIIACEKAIKVLVWKQTNLKEIQVECRTGIDIEEVLKEKGELETLKIRGMDDNVFKLVCNELKSLVNLSVKVNQDSLGVPELHKLRFLKTLFLEANDAEDINNFLSFTRNNSLEKLTLKCYPNTLTEATIIQLRLNFPNLKEIFIKSSLSSQIVNAIVQNFPNLRTFEWTKRQTYNVINFIVFPAAPEPFDFNDWYTE